MFRVIDGEPLPPIEKTAAGWARLLGVSTDKLTDLIYREYRDGGPGRPIEPVIIDLLMGRGVAAVRMVGYLAGRRRDWAGRLVARLPGCALRLDDWARLLGVSQDDMLGWLSTAWHRDGDPEAGEFLSDPTREIAADVFRAYLIRRRPEWAARLAELLPAKAPRGGVSREAERYGG